MQVWKMFVFLYRCGMEAVRIQWVLHVGGCDCILVQHSRIERSSGDPGLDPAGAAETDEEIAAHRCNHPEREEVPVVPFELGHVLEVHAIDACDRSGHSQDRSPAGKPPTDHALAR